MTRQSTKPDTVAAHLAHAHGVIALAEALFARLDDDGRSTDADAIVSLLVESGLTPTSMNRQHTERPSRNRADRYRQGSSYRVVEFEAEEVISDEYNTTTIAAALVLRLRADGHIDLAETVANVLAADARA